MLGLRGASRYATISVPLNRSRAIESILAGLERHLLAALAPTGRYLPDFLFPPPTEPRGVLAEELDAVAASPPALVRADLDKVREERRLPAVLRPLYDDPAAHLPSVVEELRRYWQAALEPVWPRVRALCTADLAYRMEQFANGGLALVLANLHPDVSFTGDLLQVDQVDDVERRRVTGVALQLEPGAGRVRLRQQRVRLVEHPPRVRAGAVGQRLGVVGGAVGAAQLLRVEGRGFHLERYWNLPGAAPISVASCSSVSSVWVKNRFNNCNTSNCNTSK